LPAWPESPSIDTADWDAYFAFHYDYELTETEGLARDHEPVEVTISVPAEMPSSWEEQTRIVHVQSGSLGVVVPHQISRETTAHAEAAGRQVIPAPAKSVNVVFLVDCPARGTATYCLFWGLSKDTAPRTDLPTANEEPGLRIKGAAPGLEVANEYYHVRLDPKSGAVLTARLADRPESENLFYGTIPIHFGVDVWSPPQSWDHDYNWESPPNQKVEAGPLMLRYHRWGPLQSYRDVEVSITYTFYAHVPYVHVSSTMEFTADRSVRAVRMGEIVVAHSHKAAPNEKDADGKSPNLFSHYAWPGRGGKTQTMEIDFHRDEQGAANLPDVASGALAILDRDVPWVAGYDAGKKYGMATLRKSQFAGNRLGRAIPQSAPCTYVSNYGWGFSYWSRPIVYPLGLKGTPEDQNTAVAAGTLFGIEEALLFFVPDDHLTQVRDTQRRFAKPLHHVFKGTGPW
jgi:hypothetical protein